MELYNTAKDELFARYAKSLFDAKMVQVCGTTMPQRSIPLVMGDPRYAEHLRQRNAAYRRRAEEACQILGEVKGITVNCPHGAFYLTVVFDEGVLNDAMTLPLPNDEVKGAIDSLAATAAHPDYRFVYYLMGSTGIVTVPLSSFYCRHNGFRITLLEHDDRQRRWMLATLAKSIEAYLASGRAR